MKVGEADENQLWTLAQARFTCRSGAHIAIAEPLPGPSFFPAGTGRYLNPSGMGKAKVKVMVVGQDFGTADYYEGVRKSGAGENLRTGTWRALLELLHASGIQAADCFFTNALLGLRAKPPMTGISPGWRDPLLVQASMNCLELQIQALRPRAILTLGLPAARAMAYLAPEECGEWGIAKRWADIDRADPVRRTVQALRHRAATPSVGALVHPSYRKRNVVLRRYGDLGGEAAELAIVAEVMR